MILVQGILFGIVLILFMLKQNTLPHNDVNMESAFWLFLPLIWLQLHIIIGYLTKSPFFVVAEIMADNKDTRLPRAIAFIGAVILFPLMLWVAMTWGGGA